MPVEWIERFRPRILTQLAKILFLKVILDLQFTLVGVLVVRPPGAVGPDRVEIGNNTAAPVLATKARASFVNGAAATHRLNTGELIGQTFATF